MKQFVQWIIMNMTVLFNALQTYNMLKVRSFETFFFFVNLLNDLKYTRISAGIKKTRQFAPSDGGRCHKRKKGGGSKDVSPRSLF